MERQKLRNRDVVNEDKISQLPEDLLVRILSSLPLTDNVIATSVLSKRWRSFWKMVPCLEFDSLYHRSIRYTFSENVYRSLVLHKAPFLESLHLTVGRKRDALDIGVLIGTAFERHVRKLGLDISYIGEDEPVRFPSVLFSCNNTLENLELKHYILLHFPSRVCLKSLRKLHLYYVEFKDDESVCNLLRGCSSLEDLIVDGIGCGHSFAIAVPSLQRLTILDGVHAFRPQGYVINAPSLKYLNVRGMFCYMFFLIENAPELLEEAKITDVSNAVNENLLASLTSVKRLSLQLSPLEIKYPTGNIVFYQLVFLELASTKRKWWNLLSLMLDSSPKLQILKLIDSNPFYKHDCLVEWEWKRPKRVPECLLYHLETFVWIEYDWEREDEEKVATYILQNARRLKKATISTEHIEPEEIAMLKKRHEMLNKLASLVRSSNSCLLDFY